MPNLDGAEEVLTGPAGDLKTFLSGMPSDIYTFQGIVSNASTKERSEIEMPREFVTAWLHIASGIIGTRDKSGSWFGHMTKAKMLILDGMRKVIQSISSTNLLDRAAVLPMDVMSLITMELLQDQVGKADDIADTYSQFLSSLVSNSAWTFGAKSKR